MDEADLWRIHSPVTTVWPKFEETSIKTWFSVVRAARHTSNGHIIHGSMIANPFIRKIKRISTSKPSNQCESMDL